MNKVTLSSAVARLKRREFRKQKSIFNLEQQQEKKLKEQKLSIDENINWDLDKIKEVVKGIDSEAVVKIEGSKSIEEIIEIFTQNSRKSCEIEGIKVTDQQFKDITEAVKLLSGVSLDKQNQES